MIAAHDRNRDRGPYQLRLSGAGGQGMILAGLILSEAAMRDGKNVVMTPSYGPEARLGASRAEVIISTGKIAHPEVTDPDLLLCLSRAAFDRYFPTLNDRATAIVDSSVLKQEPIRPRGRIRLYRFPILGMVITQIGNRIVANVVSLGIINGLEALVSWESLRAAVRARVPERFREMNERALKLGRRIAEAECRVV
ncbi:MAG: 2-oxoacid:acceptor oxidoreductase family protein [Candidatus Bipolaricaulia bacterium]